MSVPTKGEFFHLLKKSRLLTAEQRVQAKERCRGQGEASACAEQLVKQELLTSWQAAQLLERRSRFYFGKYKLLKFRGRGAMGIVFKAEHPELRRTVAVKVLSKTLLDKPRSVTRFLREIRSTAILNHPNLVVAYDADEVAGTYCLVMEYISGRSLKALSQEYGRLPARWACECIRQAALALTHVNERGLVHRDVKPSNLLVTMASSESRPHVRLLDIGLARFVSETEEDGGLTRDGQIVGTGDYMAPEQVAKAKEADIRADIYGLGATLYCLLTGSPPLAGTTILQTYMNRLQNDAPLISSLRDDIPIGLDAVVAKMLKRDARERYQTPADVAADLAAVLAGAPLDSPERDDGMGTVRYADGSPIPEELQPFAAGLAALQRRVDSTPEFTVLALGSTSEGSGSTDASCEGTAAEFLEFLQSDSSEASLDLNRRQPAESSPKRIQSIKEKASRLVRVLLRRSNRKSPSSKPAKASRPKPKQKKGRPSQRPEDRRN